MKKTLILAFGISLGVLTFSACSSDSTSSDCCSLTVASITTKYCKKDANTVTVTVNGVSTDLSGASLGNVSADTYMASVRAGGCK